MFEKTDSDSLLPQKSLKLVLEEQIMWSEHAERLGSASVCSGKLSNLDMTKSGLNNATAANDFQTFPVLLRKPVSEPLSPVGAKPFKAAVSF